MKARDESISISAELAQIRVAWNRTTDGKFTVFAEEDKAGYKKGDVIATLSKKLTNMPNVFSVIPKSQHHAI